MLGRTTKRTRPLGRPPKLQNAKEDMAKLPIWGRAPATLNRATANVNSDLEAHMATLSVAEETKSSTAVRVIYAVLSYALGLWMLLYGMSKIMALQFQVFPSTYVKPLADVSDFFAIGAFFVRCDHGLRIPAIFILLGCPGGNHGHAHCRRRPITAGSEDKQMDSRAVLFELCTGIQEVAT